LLKSTPLDFRNMAKIWSIFAFRWQRRLSLLGFRLTQVEMLTDPGKLLGKRTESTEPALVALRGMS